MIEKIRKLINKQAASNKSEPYEKAEGKRKGEKTVGKRRRGTTGERQREQNYKHVN